MIGTPVLTAMSARFTRLVYLFHRWTGVGACMLMALWFVSGMVMLFIGYPKMTPWERLQALSPLAGQHCCVSVPAALAHSAAPHQVEEIVLTAIHRRPHYRLREGDGRYLVVDAETGQAQPETDQRAALLAAQAFVPGAGAAYLGSVSEDRWTHSGALDAHRPLHRVQMDDAARTLLYISSRTGQVVMAAPRQQRLWNFAGAWLHWLYVFRDRSSDPVWSWIVIVLSGVSVITAITGTLAGLWRWRFNGTYKSGSRSPYRAPYLRWHHCVGLMFAATTCTWIFSGLMSMNPAGIFTPSGSRPDLGAYQGAKPGTHFLPLAPAQAIKLLAAEGFVPREIEWKVLDGRPYLLARNAENTTRLIVRQGEDYVVRTQWDEATLLQAARRLLPQPIAAQERLTRYDRYYFGRQPEAMMGASERRLPALRVVFSDAGGTWVHLDVQTGEPVLSMDRSQRLGRWLFGLLHSWDLPSMLDAGWVRQGLLIVLSLGGVVLSLTGIVLGYCRVRLWLGRCRRRNGPQ